jgi:hypothetical protein
MWNLYTANDFFIRFLAGGKIYQRKRRKLSVSPVYLELEY